MGCSASTESVAVDIGTDASQQTEFSDGTVDETASSIAAAVDPVRHRNNAATAATATRESHRGNSAGMTLAVVSHPAVVELWARASPEDTTTTERSPAAGPRAAQQAHGSAEPSLSSPHRLSPNNPRSSSDWPSQQRSARHGLRSTTAASSADSGAVQPTGPLAGNPLNMAITVDASASLANVQSCDSRPPSHHHPEKPRRTLLVSTVDGDGCEDDIPPSQPSGGDAEHTAARGDATSATERSLSSPRGTLQLPRLSFPARGKSPMSRSPLVQQHQQPQQLQEHRISDCSTTESGELVFMHNPLNDDAGISMTGGVEPHAGADSVYSSSSRPSMTSAAASSTFDPGDPSLRMSGAGTSISSNSITSATHRMMADVLHAVRSDEVKSTSLELDAEA